MTECAPGCGRCCDPVTTSFDPNGELNGPSAPFIREHWQVRESGVDPWGKTQWLSVCDQFDPATRLYTAHDERPPICSGYPWYGKARDKNPLDPGCTFNADVPGLLLPLFVIGGQR